MAHVGDELPLCHTGSFGGKAVAFGTSQAPLAELSALYRGSFARAVA